MRVGIIGAGLTGLAACYALRDTRHTPLVFERSDTPGGVVQSREKAGRILEYGPQRLRLTPRVDELIRELGLSEEVLSADDHLPLYIYHNNRLRVVPRDFATVVSTDLLSIQAKLRALLEPVTREVDPRESVAEAVWRKFGGDVYQNLAEPLISGIYGVSPDHMEAGDTMARVLGRAGPSGSLLMPALKFFLGASSSPPVSFQRGLQTLPNALYDTVADRVRLGTPVKDLQPTQSGFELGTSNGSVAVDGVVITTPGPQAASLLKRINPAAERALNGLSYQPLGIVHVAADIEGDGYGYQVHQDEDLRTVGVTWNVSLFDRDDVVTVFLAGDANGSVVSRSVAALGRVACDEFEQVMGVTPELLDVSVLRRAIPARDRTYRAVNRLDLPDAVYLVTNYTGGMGIPSRIRSGFGVADALEAQAG